MNIVKVNNLIIGNNADYKGLDLSFIVGGTQFYPDGTNEAYFYYDGEVANHVDLEVIDVTTYNTVKQNEENKAKSPSIEDRLSSVEDTITSLLGL
jgi:hypothetical protein